MAVLDTLSILIEADSSGLTSQLKTVVKGVVSAVESINSEGINWEKILGATATPAIIASVASAFALAITQSLQFQNSLNTSGTAAGETSDQIAATGQAALSMSQTVTPSAQDLANAMLQVSAVFGTNTQATQDITQAMAELSDSGFGNLNDIVSASLNIFKQFGVTTESQGVQVLTNLMNAASGAKESIPALADQFGSFSDQLPGVDKNVTTFANLISTYASEVKNLGATGAADIFAALATSSNTAVGPMELLGISFGEVQKSLLTDGGLTAIEGTSTTLKNMGPGASLVATQFGLSATQVGQFQTNASKLGQIAIDAKAIATNAQTIPGAFDQSDSSIRQLMLDWNTLKADMTSNAIVEGIDLIAKALLGVITGFQVIAIGIASVMDGIELLGKIALDVITGNFGQISKDAASTMNQISNLGALEIQKLGGDGSNAFTGPSGAFGGGNTNSTNSNPTSTVSSTQFNNTFNIQTTNNPAFTAQSINNQLYNQFQGVN